MSSDDSTSRSTTLAAGLAMFSMFFGAGNVVFPLGIGLYAKEMNIYATAGILITAVGAPFLGLLASTLFDGDYDTFFGRLGAPGFLLAAFIMGLIGPFGAMPRTITISFASVKRYLPAMDIWLYSLIACVLIFILTFKKARLLDILGKILTPILLGSLALIIVIGLWTAPSAPPASVDAGTAFFHGLKEGYRTMDLLASFFFSTVVLQILERGLSKDDKRSHHRMIIKGLKAGCIGMTLLALVYTGFSFVTAHHALALENTPTEEILSATAQMVLGPKASFVASVAVSLACLTTAIALAAVFAEFLQHELLGDRAAYLPCLIATLSVAYFVSTLDFYGIELIVKPILRVCYPALIVLSGCNLLHKLTGFQPVQGPVYATFAATVLYYLIQLG